MWVVVNIIRILLAVLALRSNRWAYVAFMMLGLLYFPLRVNFRFDPHPCELVFGAPLAIYSLTNFPHIVLFALGYILTAAQFQLTKWSSFLWSAGLILFFGALVEILEGVTGQGHCRARDLIPDAAGALIGALIVLALYRIGWRPRPRWSGL